MNTMQAIIILFLINLLQCQKREKLTKKIQKMCEQVDNKLQTQIKNYQKVKKNSFFKQKEFKENDGQEYYLYEVLNPNIDRNIDAITNLMYVYSYLLDPPLQDFGLYKNTLQINKCYYKQKKGNCMAFPTIEKFYFVIKKPDNQRVFQFSPEILRYIRFSNKVYIFEQILSIFRSFYQSDHFGLFLDFDQFYIDLYDQRIMIDPIVLITSTVLENNQVINSADANVLDINFRLMHPLIKNKLLDKKQTLSREDFGKQDFYNLSLIMIYIYGADPEKILNEHQCNLDCLHNEKQKSQYYFIRQYIQFRAQTENINEDNLLKYLIRMFDIIKEKSLTLTYIQCLKLFNIDSLLVEKMELHQCDYQKQFSFNDKKLIWKEDGTEIYKSIPTNNMFYLKEITIVQRFKDKNSPYDKFDSIFKQMDDINLVKNLLATRQNVATKLNNKFKGYQINQIYERCSINKRLVAWRLSYSFDDSLINYLQERQQTLNFKAKLDIIIQILEIYKSLDVFNPLDFTLEDFVVLYDNLQNIVQETQILINPIKEAMLFREYFQNNPFKRLCDQKRIVGVSQLNKYQYSAPESILACNKKLDLNQNTKFASWNMGAIILRVLGVDLQDQDNLEKIVSDLRSQVNSHLNLKTSQMLQHLVLQCFQTIVSKRIDHVKVLPTMIQIRQQYLDSFKIKKKQLIYKISQILLITEKQNNKKLITFLNPFFFQILLNFLIQIKQLSFQIFSFDHIFYVYLLYFLNLSFLILNLQLHHVKIFII